MRIDARFYIFINLLWLGGLTATVTAPALRAQNLTHCQLTDAVMLVDSILFNLEDNMMKLGHPGTDRLDRKLIITEQAAGLFDPHAKVRSDLEPDRERPGQTRRTTRWDPYDVYLQNIPQFYDTLYVTFYGQELVQLRPGKRFWSDPAFSYAFERELLAVDAQGNRYTDTIRRQAVFEVHKNGERYVPRIVSLDYSTDPDEMVVEESRERMGQIRGKCNAERERLEELQLAQRRAAAAEQARIDAIQRQEEELALALARIEEQQQEELEETRRRQRELQRQLDEARAREESKTDSLTALQEQLAAVEQQGQERSHQKQEEFDASRERLAELERAREEEQQRQRQAELGRQRDLDRMKRRLQRRKDRQRAIAPAVTLSYQASRSANPKFAALAGDFWHAFAVGVDAGYARLHVGMGVPVDEWGGSLAVDNGVFAVEEELHADSLNLWFASGQVGYPLYMGNNITLYLGGGYQVTTIQLLEAGDDKDRLVQRFVDGAPIAEVSLGWFSLGKGTGMKLSYRKTFAAKYVDWDGLRFALEYKFKVPK